MIGAIGFGFGLTTTPVLLLYLDPQTVVIVVNAVAILAFGLMLFETRREVRYRELTPVAVAGVLGCAGRGVRPQRVRPARPSHRHRGARTGAHGPRNRQQALASPEAAGHRANHRVLRLGAGDRTWRSAGRLLVLYLLGRGMDRQGVRASMSFLFVVMYSTAVAGYAVQGLITAERLLLTAAAVPAVAIGYWLSVRLTGRMNAAVFRRVVIVVIAVASIVVLVREVISL